jgi:hypothetical protein
MDASLAKESPVSTVSVLEVSQEILDSARLTPSELKVEMAVHLYAQGRLSVGKTHELADIDKAIDVLLDPAEQFGAASAGGRLLERETERNELQAELRYLEARQETRRLTIEPAAVQQMLMEMKETLRSEDVKPRRALLSKLVAWVESGAEWRLATVLFFARHSCA